jgi:DNA repair protein RecO (recombination protein O)
MASLKSPGLVLRRTPYSETSLILKVFTRDSGLITLMAKGAKRKGSKFAGLLDFFTVCQFVYPEKSRTEIHPLMDVSLVRDLPRLKSDPSRQALANVFMELYLKYMHEPAPSPPHFAWLVERLEALDEAALEGPGDRVLRLCDFVLGLCAISGFSPQFTECVHCGRSQWTGSGGTQAQRVKLDADLGGPICAACAGAGAGAGAVAYPGRLLRWLDRVQSQGERAGHLARGEEMQAEAFLLAFLGKHAGGARPVKSLDFYHETLGTA